MSCWEMGRLESYVHLSPHRDTTPDAPHTEGTPHITSAGAASAVVRPPRLQPRLSATTGLWLSPRMWACHSKIRMFRFGRVVQCRHDFRNGHDACCFKFGGVRHAGFAVPVAAGWTAVYLWLAASCPGPKCPGAGHAGLTGGVSGHGRPARAHLAGTCAPVLVASDQPLRRLYAASSRQENNPDPRGAAIIHTG